MAQPLAVLAHESPSADAQTAEIQGETATVQADGRLLTARDLQSEQQHAGAAASVGPKARGFADEAFFVGVDGGTVMAAEQIAQRSDSEWKYVNVRR